MLPVVKVSFVPVSADNVNELTGGAIQEACPEPLVESKYPLVPSAAGQFTPSSIIFPEPLGERVRSPLVLLILIVFPLNVKLSTFNWSNLLLASVIRALEAVKVPAV